MNYRRLPIFSCLILAVAACLVAINNVNPSRADTVQNSWLDQTIETTKKKDLTGDEFNQRTNNRVECSMQTAEEWVPTPWWVWIPPKEWVSSQQCLHSGATGYFGEDNTSKFIIPFGSTRIERLTDTNGSYLRSTNELSQVIPNTNKLLFITSLYGQWHNPGPRNLRIVDNWNETFPVEPTPTGLGNVQRKMTQEYDYTLNDNGTVIDGIRSGELAASANGEWLHALVEQKASILLNTNTHEIIPFADIIYPTYSMKVDVSNDGRFVARSYDLHSFKIYDTTRCGVDQGALVPRNCQSVELLDGENSLLHALFPGKEVVIGRVKFVGNGNALDMDLRVGDGTNYEYYTYRLKPSGSEPVKYLAMGDSFSSGEGAYTYRSPTDFYIDDNNYNLCHLSKNSYPYLIQQSRQFEWFNSVACSGAQIGDLGPKDPLNYLSEHSQAKILQKNNAQVNNALNNFIPGYVPQIKFNDLYHPTIATVSVGGNDFGFGKIIEKCVIGGGDNDILCYLNRDEREKLANSIEDKIPELTALFTQLKTTLSGSDPRLYVIGYPEIIAPNSICGLNVAMQPSETEFTEHLTQFINQAVKAASHRAGVNYVDVSKAFINNLGDYRLCGSAKHYAVNGLILKSQTSKKPDRIAYSESYHPNQLGQSLLASTILHSTNNFASQGSEADSTAAIPENSRVALVGDAEIRYPNYSIKLAEDVSPDTIFKDEPLNIKLQLNAGDLPPSSNLGIRGEIHSEPVGLGDLQFSNGVIHGMVALPNTVSAGYHELHVIYDDIQGNTVDLYKHVYVASSRNDFDGDGIDNNSDPCTISTQSGIDQDGDGIDDSCDGEYVKQSGITPGNGSAKITETKNIAGRAPEYFKLENSEVDASIFAVSDKAISLQPKTQKSFGNSESSHNTKKMQEKKENHRLLFFVVLGLMAVIVTTTLIRRRS